MTPEQEFNINNALLTLMYEWKIGAIDQQQALKEFKQCLKYYSRMEDVMQFEVNELVDEQLMQAYGVERTIARIKKNLSERLVEKVVEKGCASFEEVEQWEPRPIPVRHFRMKIEAIIQQKQLVNDAGRDIEKA